MINPNNLRPMWAHLLLVIISFPVGYIQGIICGFTILSFANLIGQSGITGTEYFGYWDSQGAWIDARLFGAPIGFCFAPIAQFFFLRRIHYLKGIAIGSLAVVFGGLIGTLINPSMAVLLGVLLYFFVLGYVGLKYKHIC